MDYKRVIINDSVITRTDEQGLNIKNASTASDASRLDKFITTCRMVITKSENGDFRCVFADCYFLANLQLDPVTVSI